MTAGGAGQIPLLPQVAGAVPDRAEPDGPQVEPREVGVRGDQHRQGRRVADPVQGLDQFGGGALHAGRALRQETPVDQDRRGRVGQRLSPSRAGPGWAAYSSSQSVGRLPMWLKVGASPSLNMYTPMSPVGACARMPMPPSDESSRICRTSRLPSKPKS